jgi:hypothetical protein
MEKGESASPDRLHICTNFKDQKNLQKFYELFDEVLVDESTTKGLGEHFISQLTLLLKPRSTSKMIFEACANTVVAKKGLGYLQVKNNRVLIIPASWWVKPHVNINKFTADWEEKRKTAVAKEYFDKVDIVDGNCFTWRNHPALPERNPYVVATGVKVRKDQTQIMSPRNTESEVADLSNINDRITLYNAVKADGVSDGCYHACQQELRVLYIRFRQIEAMPNTWNRLSDQEKDKVNDLFHFKAYQKDIEDAFYAISPTKKMSEMTVAEKKELFKTVPWVCVLTKLTVALGASPEAEERAVNRAKNAETTLKTAKRVTSRWNALDTRENLKGEAKDALIGELKDTNLF